MKAFGRKILWISSLLIILWMICVGIFIYRSSLQLSGNDAEKLSSITSPELELESCKSKGQKISPGFWQRIDLRAKKIPQSIKESITTVSVESGSVKIQNTDVHYLYSKQKDRKSSVPVLLLHGQSFSSETWNELGTLRILAALGYNPFAVDLPGYGKTPKISHLKRSNFVDDLITSLKIDKPVLVSPSMSGAFSLKYLIEHPEKLSGYIPVSPVHTNILNDVSCKDSNDDRMEITLNEDCQKIMHHLKSSNLKLNCIKVPTLVVWGETDRGENSAKLCLLPESQGVEIPDGKHPAYLSNPDLWHKLLYNFLSMLNETQACI